MRLHNPRQRQKVAPSVGANGARGRPTRVAFGLKTINGIAQLGPDNVAWFNAPDGNILSLTQENA